MARRRYITQPIRALCVRLVSERAAQHQVTESELLACPAWRSELADCVTDRYPDLPAQVVIDFLRCRGRRLLTPPACGAAPRPRRAVGPGLRQRVAPASDPVWNARGRMLLLYLAEQPRDWLTMADWARARDWDANLLRNTMAHVDRLVLFHEGRYHALLPEEVTERYFGGSAAATP